MVLWGKNIPRLLIVHFECKVKFSSYLGAVVSWGPSTCIQLTGVEYLSPTFGILTMCDGLSAFIGAPIAGKHFD